MSKKSKVFSYIFIITSCLFTVVPLLFMLFLSLRSTPDIIKNGMFTLPDIWHFDNYLKAWEVGRFSQYFLNSVKISLISVIGVIVFSTIASYSLVFHNFKGKKFVEMLILIGLLIPFELVIIPLYHDMKVVGLLGTLAPIYIIHIALNIPFSIFLLRGFVKEIPISLIESARMDGSSEIRNLIHIVVPLIIPALIAIIIFIFMWTWNDFMLANIMVRNEELRTLPLGLDFFKGKYSRDLPLTSAAATIIMLPIFAIYLIFQKHMIRGLMMGAVKE
jgi:raffinose/stachyose/melibiose transport system permease protein